MDDCLCARVMVGSTDSGSRNWNPDCPAHGVNSMYHNSPERIRQREINRQRLIDLQRRAAEARRQARANPQETSGT